MKSTNRNEINWKLLSSSVVYKSLHVHVCSDDVELPDGKVIQYTRVDENPFAVVVPLKSGKIVMVKNYRYPLDEMSLELPSGHIELGESPEETARRELKEETGYSAKELRQIGEFHPSVRSSQKAFVFIAKGLKKSVLNRDDSERQRTVVLPISEVYHKLHEAEIMHAASIVALAFSQPFLLRKL